MVKRTQTWLPEAGLYYYKARIYSPTLGRFLQTDPIGYGDGLNWYNYVGSDPINNTDPTGLQRCYPVTVWRAAAVTLGDGPTDRGGQWVHVGITCSAGGGGGGGTGSLGGGGGPSNGDDNERNDICELGNTFVRAADTFGEASTNITGLGLGIGSVGLLTGNPILGAAGADVILVGGALGTLSGLTQVTGGLFQGIGGGGFKNTFTGIANIGFGSAINRGLQRTLPNGGMMVDARARAERVNDVTGNIIGATSTFVNLVQPTQTQCPPQ